MLYCHVLIIGFVYSGNRIVDLEGSNSLSFPWVVLEGIYIRRKRVSYLPHLLPTLSFQ